jgi:hypothetical protein
VLSKKAGLKRKRTMTNQINTRQTTKETTRAVISGQQADTGGARNGAETTMLWFNRYLYENLVNNVQSQIESWKQKASRESSNSQSAQALRLKAEGLGYALRLLDAFEPEFRELIDRANHSGAA